MDAHSILEVDVNGEEVFMVDKRIISCYSGKINKLLIKSKDGSPRLKVIFHDFPGGAANFELITRFCYNKGKANIIPFNIANLTCAAHFMEMDKFVAETENLCEQTQRSLEEVRYWTWTELMVALKQCQDLPNAISVSILNRFLDSLVVRVSSSCEMSPCDSTSSESSSACRLSCDTRSSESVKTGSHSWWFNDLVKFEARLVKMLIELMVSRNFENGIISKFLFYYQKSRFVSASLDEKVEIMEAVVEMLCCLDIRSVSHKSLFELRRVASNLKLSQACNNKLEGMIGSLMDQASLDNLLVPSPAQKSYMYHVNLVLRFLKSFLGQGVCCVPLSRIKKVASLMDLYLAEIAPDPHLKPSKFLAVIRALPDSARDSFDGVYHALNLYLEVHAGLSEEQKMKLCLGLNHEKLSSEVTIHITRNTNFPPKFAAQALVSQQCKLKSLLQDMDQGATTIGYPSSFSQTAHNKTKGEEGSQQIVLYAKKLNLSDESEKLKAHLQGMQWRVSELEKVCMKMESQMAKVMRSRSSNQGNAGSVPYFCS